MTRKRFESLSDFRGRMSQDQTKDPAIYDRVQFMRYFGGKKNVTL
jgi:dihydroorotate dehydrogenase (fumarate)